MSIVRIKYPPTALNQIRMLFPPPTTSRKLNDVERDVFNLERQYYQLTEEWIQSPEHQTLLRTINEHILSKEKVVIDSAICLGLGSMQRKLKESEAPPSGMLEMFDDEDRLNRRLFQLIIFESALRCLQKKFKIDVVLFQDPDFRQADRIFLERRGHKVVPFPPHLQKTNRRQLDSRGLSLATDSTLLFAPCLPRVVLIQAVCAIQPSLFFGNDLMWHVNESEPVSLSHPSF
jgi:hypothetical protein